MNAKAFLNALQVPVQFGSVGCVDFYHTIELASRVRFVAVERMACANEELLGWVVRRYADSYGESWVSRVSRVAFESISEPEIKRRLDAAVVACDSSNHLTLPMDFPSQYATITNVDSAWVMRDFNPYQYGATDAITWIVGERMFYFENTFES